MGRTLRQTVAEARSCGAEFRFEGNKVLVKGLSKLPVDVQEELHAFKELIKEFLEVEGVAPAILQADSTKQIRALLVLREAELVSAEYFLKQIRGDDRYTESHITDLKIQIATLKQWLAEAIEKENSQGGKNNGFTNDSSGV